MFIDQRTTRFFRVYGLVFSFALLSACSEPSQEASQEASLVSSNPDVMRSGEEIYDAACTTCHAIGLAGAPLFGNKVIWGERANKDLAVLVETVTNGLGGMPPMGMCMDCSQEELANSVQYMLDALN